MREHAEGPDIARGQSTPGGAHHGKPDLAIQSRDGDADVLDGITRGETAIDNGQVVSHAEAKSRMTRWLKQADVAQPD